VKSIKPNFKTIGPKYGKQMKAISALVQQFDQNDIAQIEQNAGWSGLIDGETLVLDLTDFEIQAQDIPGWLVANENGLTVALDVTISAELKAEGLAREIVNRVQNLRKESAFDVTDRIHVRIDTTAQIQAAITAHKTYICTEVLANDIQFETLDIPKTEEIEAEADTAIQLSK
jgi:isoleucyl-tRNA synthetase